MSEVHRVVKNRNYTVISNYHLRDMNLSLKAKGLLSLILSLPENWKFSVRGLANINKEGVGCIGATLKELEAAGYLQRITHRTNKGTIEGTEYIFYEKSQLDKTVGTAKLTPENDSPQAKKSNQSEPHTENPDTVISDTENDEQLNTNKSNTKELNNDLLNTYPIQSSEVEEYDEPVKSKKPERIGMDKILAYRQLVKKNIEYDILAQKLNADVGMLNEIVDIIVETVCTSREYLTVASEKRNAETVKSQLLKLNAEHIEYVIDCMKNNTTDVRSAKQYMLAALFNAPSTMDTYYTLKVNHDMHGR